MIADRPIDLLPAVPVSVIGCATRSMPGNAVVQPAGPTPVRADPEQIDNDPLPRP